MSVNQKSPYNISFIASPLSTLQSEKHIWLLFAVIIFFLACAITGGFPSGLIPDLHNPFVYSGDGKFALELIERVIENHWYLNNERIGYPFGGKIVDFPISDSGSFLILKILGKIIRNPFGDFNVYFLASFPIVFIFSYVFFRCIKLRKLLSLSGGIAFCFLPFHFFRVQHVFFTWYFFIPIYFYFSYRLFLNINFSDLKNRWRSSVFWLAIAPLVMSCFGVYYSFFGVIVIMTGACAGYFSTRHIRSVIEGAIISSFITLGILINISPTLYQQITIGPNAETALRNPAETELYGLKLVQMLLPSPAHPLHTFARLTNLYNASFPLVNENSTATLGFIGAIGLLLIIIAIFLKLIDRKIDPRVSFLSLIVFILFIISTIGGLSTLFALLVTPLIRGWNRISVFIAFATIAVSLIYLQTLLKKYIPQNHQASVTALIAIGVSIFAIWDQTPISFGASLKAGNAAFISDKDFVSQIEASLPVGAAIYQLPYMPFPESGPINKLADYELATGFLQSNKLRWSYGGMKSRPGDLFFRALAQKDISIQLDIIRKLGFSGIYIDRRGFADNGQEIETRLRQILLADTIIISGDGNIVFYKIIPSAAEVADGTPPFEIMKKAGFFVDQNGVRIPRKIGDEIDFKMKSLPAFIKQIQGLSGPEPWGRWSDANLNRSVVIEFSETLPRSFDLVLRANAYGPNVGKPVEIKVGNMVNHIILTSALQEVHVKVDLTTQATKIEITPPLPSSPAEVEGAADLRKIGIGLERILLEPH